MTPGEAPRSHSVKAEHAEFWDAAATGRLMLPKCRHCGGIHWYPREICPFCLSSDIEWQESAGLGSIYSSTVFRKGGNRVIAYVELDEGLRLLTNIATDDLNAVRIGQRVRVEFAALMDASELRYPVFRPV